MFLFPVLFLKANVLMHQKTINLKKKLQTTNTVFYIFCLIINLAIIWILFFLFQLRSCKEFASHAEIFRRTSVTRDGGSTSWRKTLTFAHIASIVEIMCLTETGEPLEKCIQYCVQTKR